MIAGQIMTAASPVVATTPIIQMPMVQTPDASVAFQHLMNGASIAEPVTAEPAVPPVLSMPKSSGFFPAGSRDNTQVHGRLAVNIMPPTNTAPNTAFIPARDSDEPGEASEAEQLPSTEPEFGVYSGAATLTAAAPIPNSTIAAPRLRSKSGFPETAIAATAEPYPKFPVTALPHFSVPATQAPVDALPTSIAVRDVATPEMAITPHLDLARDTLWLDQLARDIVAASSHDGKLRFSLSPQVLGNLEVTISTQAGGVQVQLQTSTESAARIFAAEQPKLAEELRQSGIRLVSNDMMNGQQTAGYRDHPQHQHPARPMRQPTEIFHSNLADTPLPMRRDGRFA